MEMLGFSPHPEKVEKIRKAVLENLDEMPIQNIHVRLVRPGRTHILLVYVILPENYQMPLMSDLDTLRRNVLNTISDEFAPIVMDLVFSSDDDHYGLVDRKSSDAPPGK